MSQTMVIRNTPEELVAALADWVLTLATSHVDKERRPFFWSLSGGSTPRRFYDRLVVAPYREAMPWNRLTCFLGDERDVPPAHPESNFRMIQTTLGEALPDGSRPTLIRFETENAPEAALAHYHEQLARLPQNTAQFPVFDLIMLGLGPEGHVASLFPQSPGIHTDAWAMRLYAAPQKMWRYSLTMPVILAARRVVFLVTGAEKAGIVAAALAGGVDASVLPAAGVLAAKHSTWFLDRSAASRLP